MYYIIYSKQMHFLTMIMRNVQFNTLLSCTGIVCYILIFALFRTLLITNRAQVITFNVSCIRYVLIATAALSQVISLSLVVLSSLLGLLNLKFCNGFRSIVFSISYNKKCRDLVQLLYI